jgi:hypothetical protein
MQVLGKTGEENLEEFGCGVRKSDTFVRANVDVQEKCGAASQPEGLDRQ